MTTEAARDLTRIEFGDWQTNISLARLVCCVLHDEGVRPDVIIEPTCGVGNFALAALEVFSDSLKAIYCIDINRDYINEAKIRVEEFVSSHPTISFAKYEFFCSDVFSFDFNSLNVSADDNLLVLGNPPWVTNSKIGDIGGANLPQKSNLKKLRGIDAITGSGNFDISENLSCKLIERFRANHNSHFAMLMKSSVAQKLVVGGLPITNVKCYKIDSKKEFNVSVSACLFSAELKENGQSNSAREFDLYSGETVGAYGWENGHIVSDIQKYTDLSFIDGRCELTWRSGLKHDCKKVMELKKTEVGYVNGFGEKVDIEEDLVHPLIKSSDIKRLEIESSRSYVIVTQTSVGADTEWIKYKFPKTYAYLDSHSELFENRKSSIYQGKPRFSIFGIGEYSFSPYKVVAAGLGASLSFATVLPINGKVVMVDDTCYQISLESERAAKIFAQILRSDAVKSFLASITFSDAKRRLCKSSLMRINLKAAAKAALDDAHISNDDYNFALSSLPHNTLF